MHNRLPQWIRTPHRSGLHEVKHLLRTHRLSTVCEEARCPNRGECFSKPTATFLILGPQCTRSCAFCSVVSGDPRPVDDSEPERVAAAALQLNLKYVVITSVSRDDLPDGGAEQFAKTVYALRSALPTARIEVLVPDFRGDLDALRAVLDAKPDVLNHNMETVKRIYPLVRPQADYQRSLALLAAAKDISPGMITKSGLMVGLGETPEEVRILLSDLRGSACDFLTVGQYLRPSKKNFPVVEYIRPETFEELGKEALALGFRFVASGPLVRSSMHAEEMYRNGSSSRPAQP
ncbi:MAG: lipoyl synthase [Nitrospirae bacterium]|nr:lipoyl synthase [Nitrospirota bacterium]